MLLSLLIMLAGLVLPWPQGTGLSWLLLAAWLTRYDIARRNARRQGFAAYTARSVLLGYFWMGISGLMLLWKGLPYLAGPHFERTLHGVFVGFVFSMIFAHGPIIFPALCKLPVRFSSWFYLPLACLHLSLLLRWLLNPNWGALGNFLAMLVFALTMITHYQPGHNPWLPKLESDQSPTAA